MILAPRSCPSRPGFAITTRIGRATLASIWRCASPSWAPPRPGRTPAGRSPATWSRTASARLLLDCGAGVLARLREQRQLAARGRDRDHALPPRPLGRPRPVGLGRALRAGPGCREAARSGCRPGRDRAARRTWARTSGGRRCSRAGVRAPGVRRRTSRSGPPASRSCRCASSTTRSDARTPCACTNGSGLLRLLRATPGPCDRAGRDRARRRPVRLRGHARPAASSDGADRGPPGGRRGGRRVRRPAAPAGSLLTHRPRELPVDDGLELAFDGLELPVGDAS